MTFDADLPTTSRTRATSRPGCWRSSPPGSEELGPMPKTMFDKIWEAHEVAEASLHRPASRPRSDVAAGVRGSAAEGRPSDGRTDDRHRRPQRADLRERRGRSPTRSRSQLEALEPTAGTSASPLRAQPAAGHRPRHRPGARLTQPGMTIVCGDSHTSTHGAFGALAFGIGTSEVEHVLATQTVLQDRPQTMEIRFSARCRPASPPKT